MAKVSPVSIKYLIHANFSVEGALEKPDVIGALFGQTEGLLGSDLDMRELQKEGKIGRIEVDLERDGKRTTGNIKIPTALEQSETTLIAAAIETIERIGPSDAHIEVEKIEDVRGSKRDYILERAKKLMGSIAGSTDSKDISNQIKSSAKDTAIQEYGEEKLPAGDISGNEVIVVEGRADVVNLLRAGVNNVIGMNGTKLPDTVAELGKKKELTLYLDGDRGGKLIAQNVLDNAEVKYVAIAPDGKEVEELTGKEVLTNLRKKMPVEEYKEKYMKKSLGVHKSGYRKKESYKKQRTSDSQESKKKPQTEKIELTDENKQKLKKFMKENEGSGKSILLDSSLEKMRTVSTKSLTLSLKKSKDTPAVIVIDGTVTGPMLNAAENSNCQIVVASNFATTDTNLKLLSL